MLRPLGAQKFVTFQGGSDSVLAAFFPRKMGMSAYNFAHTAESNGAFPLLCREGYNILNWFSYNKLRRRTK